jgi:single-strand DNA-binding protein
MPSYSKAIVVGNLTRDVEVKYLQSGTAVAEVAVAVNEKRKGADGKQIEEVSFIDVTLWGKTAELASEYLGKGSPIMIEGRLKQDHWQDKDTGAKRSKLRVVCEKLVFIGSKGERHTGPSPDPSEAPRDNEYSQEVPDEQPRTQPLDDEIPF